MRDNKLDCKAVEAQCLRSVLDAGCAFGALVRYVDPLPYIGIDWSKLAVLEARREHEHHYGVFLWGDVLTLGEGWYKSVGTVVAMQFIEHFADPRAVFMHLRKYARKNVIITVPRGLPRAGNTEGHLSGWEDEAALIDTLSNGSRIRVVPLENCDPAHIGVLAWW